MPLSVSPAPQPKTCVADDVLVDVHVAPDKVDPLGHECVTVAGAEFGVFR